MGPDATHASYDAFIDTWRTVRDCVAGSRAVKAAAERYLPRLHKQQNDSYDAYVKRAIFFNACRRTLKAMLGFVFRNNPDNKYPKSMKGFMVPFLKDATMTGKSFYNVAKETCG